MCYYLISMEGNNFRDSKIRGVYKVMKKFWLLIVIGTVLFMPKGVEAKEYSVGYIYNDGNYHNKFLEIESGDVITYDIDKDVAKLRFIDLFVVEDNKNKIYDTRPVRQAQL